MFQITLSGCPVESTTSYLTYKRAAHVATLRYSDPPVRAPELSHIPRRTWLQKGYRIEPFQDRPLAEDWRVRAIQNPGHVCPGAPVLTTLRRLWKIPDTSTRQEREAKRGHREKMIDFRARSYFRDMERRQGGGANDSQCWTMMPNGLPCLLLRGHQGECSL